MQECLTMQTGKTKCRAFSCRWDVIFTAKTLSLGHYLIWCVSRWETEDQNISVSYKVWAILGSEDSSAGLCFKERTTAAVFALATSKIGTAEQNKMNILKQ